MALLQSQVRNVVRKVAELLGDGGVAEVQHDVEAQRLQGGQVALPGQVIKLDAGGVLLVLRQTQHFQMVVTHKVFSLCFWAAQSKILEIQTNIQHDLNSEVKSASGTLSL